MPSHAVTAQGRRAAWIPAVEAGALAAFAWTWGRWAADVAEAASGTARAGDAAAPATVLIVGAAALAALVAADFASGLGHWLCDRFFDERAPIVGPLVVRTFREHHGDPQALVRHGFVELNGDSALVCLPVVAAVGAFLPDAAGGAGPLAAHAFALVFTLAILLTNSVHRWAHAARVPGAVARLQRLGLILRPEAHARHHCGAHDRAFCITTGWLNPLLDRTRLFARLEAGLARLGLRPDAG